jgi:serine/threonine-protein kinase
VKLMDFGISQMVDLQRLTVTGQLLGSPAYMSPEHVEGQPLDFRTDVFAIGIVLYQLTTGKLPFEGKNPHEILKRIAECKFTDPRQANPRIGNELGKIILRAMARDPAERFADISEMVAALDAYCTGSGLGPAQQELMRYFQSPAAYDLALKERLVDHLVRKGKSHLPDAKPAALEAFDRVLALDPTNPTVLGVLEKMRGTRRWKHGVAIGVGLVVIAGLAFGARRMIERSKVEPSAISRVEMGSATNPIRDPSTITVPDTVIDERPIAAIDAAVASNGGGGGGGGGIPDRPPRGSIDATPAATTTAVIVHVLPATSTLSIDGGVPETRPDGRFSIDVPAGGKVKVQAAHSDKTYESRGLTLDGTKPEVNIELGRLPATLVLKCDNEKATVTVDGRVRQIDDTVDIPFDTSTITDRSVVVEFGAEDKFDKQTIQVNAGETKEVKCAL